MAHSTNRIPIILLVEDSPDDELLMRRAFEKKSIRSRCITVRNGCEAMRYLTGSDQYADRSVYPLPDLVLLDVKMPLAGGFEFMRWLRGQDAFKRLIVVALSGSNRDHDIQLAYELGVNSFLVKPVAHEALCNMVEALGAYWTRWNCTPLPAQSALTAATR